MKQVFVSGTYYVPQKGKPPPKSKRYPRTQVRTMPAMKWKRARDPVFSVQVRRRGEAWEKKKVGDVDKRGKFVVVRNLETRAIEKYMRCNIWFHKQGARRVPSPFLCGGSKYVRKEKRERAPMKMPKIVPVVYRGWLDYGDFGWMINQSEWRDSCLFLFNDNCKQWFENSLEPGGGNACIRPEKQFGRAFGIPTGDYLLPGGPGFTSLPKFKSMIDYFFHKLVDFISENEERRGKSYDKIFFSSVDEEGSEIGTGIFRVDKEVKAYITDCIKSKLLKALYTKRCVLRHLKAGVKFTPSPSDFFFYPDIVDKDGKTWNTLLEYNL